MKKGYSLIEMLVVIGIFAMLAVLVTQIMAASLRGTKKSTSATTDRSGISYAVGVMERQLRGAQTIIDCPNNTSINYKDQDGNSGSFSFNSGGQSIASGSASLTSSDIKVTGLNFVCVLQKPQSVIINATAGNATIETKVYLRNN